MANHVFISYSRKDQDFARKLEDELRKRGFDPWVDARIDFGDRWWRTIVKQIRSCAAFVVVMTPDSEQSDWVEKEVMLALEDRKPLFPLLLRGKRFPILIDRQYVSVSGGRMPPRRFYERLGREARIERAPEEPKPAPLVQRSSHLAEPPIVVPQVARPSVMERTLSSEPEMILIPGGEFLMGSDPQKDKDASSDEQPQHTLYLPDYYMAKTLVTNVQYAAFVERTNHRQPKHWKAGKPLRGKGGHPVVHVSWHDAVAYCNWLAETTGKPYRLPSEAEWEKGARGIDGRIYPWGDEWDANRCSSREGGKDSTTPVGAYPEGASPYGLLDMCGNVWEWMRSREASYPYLATDGREDLGGFAARVVRGGSWLFSEGFARCAFRFRYLPDLFDGNLGFRVVVSLASSES